MERIVHKSTSFEDAERWDREQQRALSPQQRLDIAKTLRDRVYGAAAPDVREATPRR